MFYLRTLPPSFCAVKALQLAKVVNLVKRVNLLSESLRIQRFRFVNKPLPTELTMVLIIQKHLSGYRQRASWYEF
jgi:hypothetical protein